jgi:hypothetical protein
VLVEIPRPTILPANDRKHKNVGGVEITVFPIFIVAFQGYFADSSLTSQKSVSWI